MSDKFITLDDLVNELLSIEKTELPKARNFGERIRNPFKRRDVEKQIQDEIAVDNAKILKNGKEAKEFLESIYYKDLIRPLFEQDIKGGIQRLIREGEAMSEAEIKSEIAVIKRALSKIASIRLKIIQAEGLKEDGKI